MLVEEDRSRYLFLTTPFYWAGPQLGDVKITLLISPKENVEDAAEKFTSALPSSLGSSSTTTALSSSSSTTSSGAASFLAPPVDGAAVQATRSAPSLNETWCSPDVDLWVAIDPLVVPSPPIIVELQWGERKDPEVLTSACVTMFVSWDGDDRLSSLV